MKKISILLVVLGLLLIVSPLVRPIFAQGPIHFEYEGDKGPEHWGDLAPEFALCATGTEQSPIDIPADAPLDATPITFNYQSVPLAILNNGHTIQVNYAAGSSITVDGKQYDLAQFHFHIPSEHELGGELKNMELHLVHKAADGALAVVGVFLVVGAENAALAPVFSHMPKEEQEVEPVEGVTVDAAGFLPADHSYFGYNGSLTTPPCSQAVKWHVLKTPVEISQGQIDAFKAIFELNARPVQPLGTRTFLTGATLPSTGGDIFGATWVLVGTGIVTLASGLGLLRYSRRRA